MKTSANPERFAARAASLSLLSLSLSLSLFMLLLAGCGGGGGSGTASASDPVGITGSVTGAGAGVSGGGASDSGTDGGSLLALNGDASDAFTADSGVDPDATDDRDSDADDRRDDGGDGRTDAEPTADDSGATDLSDAASDPDAGDSDETGDEGGGGVQPPAGIGGLRVLAANDLGMHCADQDYQVFSILPPFNVVHAQVIEAGADGAEPRILTDAEVDVVYSATANPNDPAGASSINTSSRNLSGVFKSNFWETIDGTSQAGVPVTRTRGGVVYDPLYPNVLALDPDISAWPANCDPASGRCDSALALFDPLPGELGIPVPDANVLYPESGVGAIAVGQQAMPGPANLPQHFDRFDRDLPFFVNFPFGSRIRGVNWFAADGIPILPVDDSGRPNAYPMMKVQAISKGGDPLVPDNVLASLDVVLPVASEADCQNCHALAVDCADPDLPLDIVNTACSEAAISPTRETGTTFAVVALQDAPGDTVTQRLLNAAKLNILRLHDARHGDRYTSSVDGSATVCDASADPGDPDCLANQTPVQCSQCHYSPALDLAQVGPVDEPEQGVKGRQQTRHISMSSAMHGHHGQFTDLFPAMPGPVGRDRLTAERILGETCYQCHPGKRTQCLRGAMFSGGVVCQDCHGNMAEVGNDFTVGLPEGKGLDLSKRVPWAHEAGCQSCHTGDALDNQSGQPGALPADAHGIRLLQAYVSKPHPVDGSPVAGMRVASNKRFAEDESLYRLSKGHGGVMCEGCHGSTHAIWPIQNPFANDNVAANQLQGHAGTLTECDTCHEPGSLGLTLDGPHGMHPVNDPLWNREHEEMFERNRGACQACHGREGEGTVLSVMAETRTLRCEDDHPACGSDETITLDKGTPVGCATCHENEMD